MEPDEKLPPVKYGVTLEVESGHDLYAVVVLSINPEDVEDWTLGLKRVAHSMAPRPSYTWIAEKLRIFADEVELRGMVEGESNEGTSNGE